MIYAKLPQLIIIINKIFSNTFLSFINLKLKK